MADSLMLARFVAAGIVRQRVRDYEQAEKSSLRGKNRQLAATKHLMLMPEWKWLDAMEESTLAARGLR